MIPVALRRRSDTFPPSRLGSCRKDYRPDRNRHLQQAPRPAWCWRGAMPRGQGVGRKKLAICQVAAEGGSRGQLVSEERLDRGHRTPAPACWRLAGCYPLGRAMPR
jgi:hypothetical protein